MKDLTPVEAGAVNWMWVPPPAIVAAPPPFTADTLEIVMGSPSGSESLARTWMLMTPEVSAVALSFTATGGAFGAALTTTVTVALAVPPLPSDSV
ncbi:hypothetical protein D3C72_1746010 [compost metagenome]